MSTEELTEFRQKLLDDLRVEMMALHLGDDYCVTLQEAARIIGVSERQMYRLKDDGVLNVGYVGNSPRMSLGQIRRFMRDSVAPKR